MRTPLCRLGLAVLLSGLPALAIAQDTSAPPPASLAYYEGTVQLDREGSTETVSGPTLLVDGDRLRTRDGRVEVVFGDGSLLHADRDTAVEWLGPSHVRLTEGRIRVRTSASAASYQVDTPPGALRLEPRGEYDLSLEPGDGLQISIARGVAELDGAAGTLVARGGEALVIDRDGRADLRRYNSARFDDFSRWAYERANGDAYGQSARYLPPQVRAYGASLDTYGRWDYLAPYGYVWYPAVAATWRPYSHGGWRYTRYGWTWFGLDPWAYPTHHYGRWGFSGSVWFWIPGKIWGPAWVSWGYAPGYVSWCPLGWDGRPVIAFSYRVTRIGYDPWRAWTAIPRHRFGIRGPIHSWIVDGHRMPDRARRAFVFQSVPPRAPAHTVWRDHAVPRGTAGVPAARAVGVRPDVAVPRSHGQSWSTPSAGTRMTPPASGAVRRPGPTAPAAPSPPAASSQSPSAAPRVDPRPDARYAYPRRPDDGRYRPETADVFCGRARTHEAAPATGGQRSGQSWNPRSRPSSPPAAQPQPAPRGYGAVERSRPRGGGGASHAAQSQPAPRGHGAVERARPRGGDGASHARPSSGGGRNGHSSSQGGVRRPPPR